MSYRFFAVAALALPLSLAVDAARADCLWGVGMAELDLAALERAAPLAADDTLSLGPGGSSWISGAEDDFADRSRLAFGAIGAAGEETARNAAAIESRITWARDRLALARAHAGRGEMDACAAALDQAREAIAGARGAFR